MIVRTTGSMVAVARWQWRSMILFTLASTVVVWLHWGLGWGWLKIPVTPVGVLGGALGIFVSFRTNAAYARWWDGRKLWGGLINGSRMLASQAVAYLSPESQLVREVVERQILYVHLLRCSLREQNPWEDEDILRFSDAALRETLRVESNPPHAVLTAQLSALRAAADAGRIDAFRLQSFDGTIRSILDDQGGCERIKKTPMPMGYGYFALLLIRAFGTLFPLAVVADLHWFTIPVSILVSSGFLMISEVGRVLEDPFNLFWNALPLQSITRTIENNLRQSLGDRDLLPAIAPQDGVLM